MRDKFLKMFLSSETLNKTLGWGQDRVRELEQHAKDIGEVLDQREEDFVQLQSHLSNRNETIDELETEIKRLTGLTDQLSSNCTILQSDEERHQRHRRERMLDEITLICVRDGIERMNSESTAEKAWGRLCRDIADSICRGINEYDANN
jgi:archaellum component FlaC